MDCIVNCLSFYLFELLVFGYSDTEPHYVLKKTTSNRENLFFFHFRFFFSFSHGWLRVAVDFPPLHVVYQVNRVCVCAALSYLVYAIITLIFISSLCARIIFISLIFALFSFIRVCLFGRFTCITASPHICSRIVTKFLAASFIQNVSCFYILIIYFMYKFIAQHRLID